MRIGHFSDLHGRISRIPSEIPDVWVCSGDFFPNSDNEGVAEREIPYQLMWFEQNAEEIIRRLAGRPLIWVPGNHDFVSLAALLSARGVETYDLTEGPVDIGGHRWAGFREVPYMSGVWQGEVQDFENVTRVAFEADPTILVTHAPPAGILDDDGGMGHGHGITALVRSLAYAPHRIVAHFFGHIHCQGGQDMEEMGVRFFNGAERGRIVDI